MNRSLLKSAREKGLVCAVDDEAFGLADLTAIRAAGPDAARFLNSQLTNEVEGLEPGRGNLNARVSRTGHLEHVFSLHRMSAEEFFLVGETTSAAELLQSLDRFLFADKVELTLEQGQWIHLQGGKVESLLPEDLRHEFDAVIMDSGDLAVRRSLTGEPGLLVWGKPDATDWIRRAQAVGMEAVGSVAYSEGLETLRMEAGGIRVAADFAGAKHLLPETGLEHQAVSYSKGCYLGQEVIARVRTYGSVPRALRAVLLDTSVDEIPASGSNVLNSEGKKIGQWSSRTESLEAEGVLAYAFLNRDSRTPGNRLRIQLESGVAEAAVALLPLYRAKDSRERIATLYDKAVRVYARGEVEQALDHLEAVLRLDPAHADAYELIGVMLGKTGRFHEAIDFFRRMEEVAPDEPMVNTNLSVFYMKIGDKQTAEDQSGIATQKKFRQTKWKDKSTAEIAEEQAIAARKGAERKLVMFAKVLEIDADDGVALFGSGTSHAVLGQWQDAAASFARAVEVDEQNSAAHLGLGKALEALGKPEAAVEAYKRGMEIASRRGDLMPLREMEHRVLLLSR
ncbi:MAG: tetratricopeptide repeat protein [Myxococcota bacterium]|nr:tetratricopeptide repeat protein [Myxococcota bacterium]